MGARKTALHVLMACRQEGAWSNGILKEYIQRDGLDRREAALATRLSYGVLQNRLLLDFYLKQLLTGKLRSLHPVVRDILHLGLYQIYLMDKIPESAAVNEAVELCKKHNKNAASLVNGVLRNAIRSKDTLQQPRSYQEIYSHPQKLIDLLCEDVGKSRLAPMLKANNDIPPTVIQVNTLVCDAETLKTRLEQEGVAVTAHPWLNDCLILSSTGSVDCLESFRQGLFYVQDAAAKLSVLCAQIPKGAKVLDCCAAPGGKSFAAAMAGAGEITSCDVHPHKIPLIEKGAQRLGITHLQAVCQDASVNVAEWQNAMDVVIADVPCSGYGIIRKKPDIRYKDPDTMLDLPALQRAILDNQATYVKPGGLLLYSTCTLLRRENEDIVNAFMADRPDFTLEPLPLPSALPKNESGMLTLVPGEYDTDGFFIARLRRAL